MGRPKTPFISSVLASYLLFGVVSSWGVEGKENDCSPSSCGSLTIRYPFYLKGDPGECGAPGYELICDGNTTILEFRSGKYYVRDIFYETRAIRVTDFGLASGACGLPSQTLSPLTNYTGERFFVDRLSYRSWASFVNCTSASQKQLYSLVPCLSRNNSFVYVTYGSEVESLAPSCGFLAMIPTSNIFDPATPYEVDILEQLEEGFILYWAGSASLKYLFHQCFKESSDEFKDIARSISGLSTTEQTIYWITSPVFFEAAFLSCCLDGDEGKYYHSHAAFAAATVLIVVIDVAAPLLVIALLGRFVLAPLAVVAFLAYEFRKNQAPPIDDVEKFLRNHQALAPKRYGYTDIIAMTRHFKDKLGQGGFGSVYKGELPGNFLVAVKMLGNSKCNGDDFISEVSTVGRIHHVNVVRLLGFCSEGSNRALVYEYLPKGSLDKHIFSSNAADRRPFTWEKLNDIALGVARGIDYLHRGCDMRILHFDIKPHNILMDNSFNPKVSDFGLAKLYPKGYSMVSLSAARGTIGYIAPEQISRSFGVVSYKSDVYSFGMLLLEMAGGRRNVDPKADKSSQIYYPSWVYDQLKQQEAIEMIDATAIGEVERKLSIVGLWCIQTKPSDRPSMSRVVEMLEADVQGLQMPPKPFFSSTPSLSIRESRIEPSSSAGLSIISEHESLS